MAPQSRVPISAIPHRLRAHRLKPSTTLIMSTTPMSDVALGGAPMSEIALGGAPISEVAVDGVSGSATANWLTLGNRVATIETTTKESQEEIIALNGKLAVLVMHMADFVKKMDEMTEYPRKNPLGQTVGQHLPPTHPFLAPSSTVF